MSPTMRRLGAALLFWAAPGAWAAELNALSDLKISPIPNGAQVVVRGTRPPTFTVFRLNDPDRLIVDLSAADASAIKGHHEGTGPVAGVVASQFSDDRASVGRILVGLTASAQYDVKAQGNQVVVAVHNGAKTAAAPPASAAPEPTPAVKPAPPQPEGVVASRVDEKPVTRAAHRVTGVTFSGERLRIMTDGELAKYELIELSNPPRLALDLFGVTLSARLPKVSSRYLERLRSGSHADKVRLVFHAKGEMPTYNVQRTARGLELSLGASAPAQVAVTPKGGDEGEAEIEIDGQKVALGSSEIAPIPAAPKSAAPVDVKDIAFDEDPNGGRVEVKLSRASEWKIDRPDDASAVLTLENARLPKSLERSLDTSALDTPVKMVSAFSAPGGAGQVRIVVAASGALQESVVKTPQGLSWKLTSKGVKTEQVVVNPKTAGAAEEAVAYAAQGQTQRTRYVGKRVSFEFKDIDIHNLLRVIAEVSKKNIVVADDVTGK
ncbi:MAG TPA: AMIN domain-containing protein, partial [Myxococcaceae bacterium]|nr:AMIN domain-containing protein [Myxococcaceae bacterium]